MKTKVREHPLLLGGSLGCCKITGHRSVNSGIPKHEQPVVEVAMSERDSICASTENPESWKPVAGFEGRYEVSDQGRIRSLGTYRASYFGLILAHWVKNKGYHYVSLRQGKTRKSFAVHRMVLEAFVGPCPIGKQAAHDNGDPSDNKLANLRWATAKENIADRARHGRTSCGENQGSSKLDRHVVKTIKRLNGLGFSAYEIARLACVHPSTINSIWEGRSWKHI